MDIKVNVWEEDILLPTYGIGKPEKNGSADFPGW